MDKYIGKRLDGRYLVEELIGIGGMANVYKATDLLEHTAVAVKILKDEFAESDEFLRRFKNESKAISLLSHPNIVKVFDVSFSEKVNYIVMEYIDGITLKEYIQQKNILPWKDAVHFITQILRALQHAHDRGIVHRDIKPQNIMLLPDGSLKVMDFGIARFARSENRTITDRAIGSVHYISPEQARGDETDAKADLYSAGVILFEMLTGQLPFEADTAVSVAIKQISDLPVSPRQLNPDIPEGLEEITLKAMQKDVDRRYQSASEMLSDIEEFKRNPSISFQYKYFVDSEPTKYMDAIKEVRTEQEEPAPEKKGGKKKKKKGFFSIFYKDDGSRNNMAILAGIASAFLVAAMLLIGGMAIFSTGIFGGRVAAPNLVGMSLEDAKAKYPDFKYKEGDPVFSDEIEAGLIAEQSPKGNARMKKNGTIEVHLSQGPEVLVVQDVYGMEASAAEAALRKQGLKPVIEHKKSDSVPVNFVIETSPAKGTEVQKGDEVTIYVSQDEDTEEQVKVPLLSGTDKAGAESALKGVGLTLGKVTEVESDKPKGIVVGQDPSSGTEVDAGTIVNIEVSKGPKEPTKVSVSVALPKGIGSIQLKVYQDGQMIKDAGELNPNYGGSGSYSIEVSGLESDMPVTVTFQINGKPYQSYTVNFATGKATLKEDHSGDAAFKPAPTPPTSSSQSAAQGGNAGGEVKG